MKEAILAEALARVEYKLDLLIQWMQAPGGPPIDPLHFVGRPCPCCGMPVEHVVDMSANVVKRSCGCKTGKVPVSLFDVKGDASGNPK